MAFSHCPYPLSPKHVLDRGVCARRRVEDEIKSAAVRWRHPIERKSNKKWNGIDEKVAEHITSDYQASGTYGIAPRKKEAKRLKKFSSRDPSLNS